MEIQKQISKFQYIGSTIYNFSIENEFAFLDNLNQCEKSIDLSHKMGEIQKTEDKLLGSITLNVELLMCNEEDNRKCTIALSITGFFTIDEKTAQKDFEQMLKINGITALYSISRAFILSTTSQITPSGSVILPMVNVISYSKELNEKCQKDNNETDKKQ